MSRNSDVEGKLMAVEITYPDGTKIVIPRAAISKDNHVDGMFDFLDLQGKVVDQIPMRHGLHWRTTDEPPVEREEAPLKAYVAKL
jgi:hypothetical protein